VEEERGVLGGANMGWRQGVLRINYVLNRTRGWGSTGGRVMAGSPRCVAAGQHGVGPGGVSEEHLVLRRSETPQ